MEQLAEIGRFKDGEFDMLYAPAVLVYIFMAASVTFFVLPRISTNSPAWMSFLIGAAMGLITYGVFDMTNMAILKNYPIAFAIVDMAWGSFAYGLVTLITKTVRDL